VSEADTGVSCGPFDNSASRFEETALLGVLNNVQRCAVLDGTTRIHELCLAEDLTASLLGEVVQTDERGISNSYYRSDSLSRTGITLMIGAPPVKPLETP